MKAPRTGSIPDTAFWRLEFEIIVEVIRSQYDEHVLFSAHYHLCCLSI